MRSPLLLSVPIFMVILSAFAPAAHADRFDNQITQLNAQNTQSAVSSQTLGAQAVSLSDTITGLQSEIAALDGQIQGSQAKIEGLKADIAKNEAELARQRELLSINLRQMYTEHDISTLEMLASSKNFSYFIDREQYRTDLGTKIDATVKHIAALTNELNNQKQSVEKLLADQQAMQSRLDAQRSETTRLLGLNQAQQAVYNQTVATNNSQISRLRRLQAAENSRGFVTSTPAPTVSRTARRVAAASGYSAPSAARAASSNPAPAVRSGGGSYPYANAAWPNSAIDPWGMYQRQCVSYTAWKVANSGRHMPYWGGRGNANQWDDNARAAGIPVDGNPRVGDVAVSNAGSYGHVMYVEAVYGDGTIAISQYNAGWDGRYSEGRRSSAGLVFIHF